MHPYNYPFLPVKSQVQARLFAGYIDLLDAQVAPNAVAELITEVCAKSAHLRDKRNKQLMVC